MNEKLTSLPHHSLPHHRLVAHQVALQLALAVGRAEIRDGHLRDQITRAANGVVLNIGEGAGKRTPADKARSFTVARGEASEAAAAIELAGLFGHIDSAAVEELLHLASRSIALLSGLINKRW